MSIGKFSRSLILLLALGFLLRIVVMFWSFQFRENTDVLRHRDRARIAHVYGLDKTYNLDYVNFGTLGNNMPPGSLYFDVAAYEALIPITKLYLRVSHPTPQIMQIINGSLINAFLRFPSIIADLLLAFLIYFIVKSKKAQKAGLFASSLFLFNPVIIYNSAFWGQMDSLNNLLLILAIYLLYKKQYFGAILSFFLSLYIKLSLLFLLPFFLLVTYRLIKNKLSCLLSLVFSFILISIFTLPISKTPHLWLIKFVFETAKGEMQNITAFALNFWWFLFYPYIKIGAPINLFNFSEIQLIDSPLTSNLFLGLPQNMWALILFGLTSLPPLLKTVFADKKQLSALPFQFLFFSLLVLLGFLFLPRMHERYMYPFFPLFATYLGFEKKYLWIFLSLSALNLFNLYLVWHPMMLPFIPYLLMNNRLFQWTISLLTVFIGLVFYIKSIKTFYAIKE